MAVQVKKKNVRGWGLGFAVLGPRYKDLGLGFQVLGLGGWPLLGLLLGGCQCGQRYALRDDQW